MLVKSTARYVEQSTCGMNTTAGQSNSGEKIETLCWLCDRYGHLARYCGVIRQQKVDDHMYNVERRLELREELLWEGTRVYGVVNCGFAKLAR